MTTAARVLCLANERSVSPHRGVNSTLIPPRFCTGNDTVTPTLSRYPSEPATHSSVLSPAATSRVPPPTPTSLSLRVLPFRSAPHPLRSQLLCVHSLLSRRFSLSLFLSFAFLSARFTRFCEFPFSLFLPLCFPDIFLISCASRFTLRVDLFRNFTAKDERKRWRARGKEKWRRERDAKRAEMAADDGFGVSFRRGFAIDPLNFSLLPLVALFLLCLLLHSFLCYALSSSFSAFLPCRS